MEEKEVSKEESKSGSGNGLRNIGFVILGMSLMIFFLQGLTIYLANISERNLRAQKNNSNTVSKPSEEKPAKDEYTEFNNEIQAGEWKSLGTDISKVKDVYDVLEEYTYSFERKSGGLSFSSKELLEIAVWNIKWADLKNVHEDSFSGNKTGILSMDVVDKNLKKYFGNNYKLDTSIFDGSNDIYDNNIYEWFEFPSYNAETKEISVLTKGGTDGYGTTGQGPSPTFITRKVVDVSELNDELKVIEKAIYIKFLNYSYSDHSSVYSICKFSNNNCIDELEINDSEAHLYTISVDDYIDQASTITSLYHKAEDGSYYFVSSEING